ncbi:hypothetical protein [Epidermidibacterium keratini]|nr:hypothetical protein [Epidermidibacterium keratini]
MPDAIGPTVSDPLEHSLASGITLRVAKLIGRVEDGDNATHD